MSRYFISGGAGFLGINLTRFLLEKGHAVVSFDIEKEYNYPEKDDSRVAVITGDIRDFEAVKAAMRGCDMVVHTAAALPLYSPEDIRTTDIDGTKNVIQAAYEHKTARFIQISSTAVYGIPDHHPLLEDDELIGVGPYGVAKIGAEKICDEYREIGLVVPIIRP
jgi:nucleoside-diphosphate-sugar epimerase